MEKLFKLQLNKKQENLHSLNSKMNKQQKILYKKTVKKSVVEKLE